MLDPVLVWRLRPNCQRRDVLRRVKRSLRRNLHAYRFLGDRWNLLLYRLGVHRALAPEAFRAQWSQAARDAFDRTLAEIAEVKRICDRRGIRLLVVAVPDRAEVDDTLWDRYVTVAGGLLDETGRHRARRLLMAFLAQHGIAAIDLAPTVRTALARGDVYARYDPHFNERGYALVADAVARELRRRGWLGTPGGATIR